MSIGSDHYEADFEPEEVAAAPLEEEEHHLRLAVELFAVRDLQTAGSLYLIYSYPLMGQKPVRTQPVMIRKNTECRIDNAYQAFEFFMTKSRLYPTLSGTPLTLEVMQTDKYEKDTRLGQITMQMEQVLRAPLKKMPQTMLRLYDEWLPIKTDTEDTIGSIRLKVYLEDLGPKAPGVVLAEPQSTDYQAAWELELWRRAEEAKWRATLKDKENQHLADVTEQLIAKETAREKTFHALINELNQMDLKLRSKAMALQSREQRIAGLEEELKQQINDTGRKLAVKEEEVVSLKSRLAETRSSGQKETAAVSAKLAQCREELAKTEEELRKVRREAESPLVLQLQKELAMKAVAITELERKLEAANTQKEKFRQQCEALKSSLSKATAQYQEEKKHWESREREELARYRLEAASKPSPDDQREVNEAKQLFSQLQQTLSQTAPPAPVVSENTLRKPMAYTTTVMRGTQSVEGSGGKRAALLRERRRLVEEDGYREDDPLIKQLDAGILELSREEM